MNVSRYLSTVLAIVYAASFSPARASAFQGAQFQRKPHLAQTLKLLNGNTAYVFTDGSARIYSKDKRSVEFRTLYPRGPYEDASVAALGSNDKDLAAQLTAAPKRPFAAATVLVVFRAGVRSSPVIALSSNRVLAMRRARTPALLARAVPPYTNDASLNTLMAKLGVDRSERLFRSSNTSTLEAMHARAQAELGHPVLDVANAYRLHVTNAPVRRAVLQLLKSPAVAYAEPDWYVSTMETLALHVPRAELRRAQRAGAAMRLPFAVGNAVPSNFAVSQSAQSLLNSHATDALGAYDEIDRTFHQLPGQGETITNVSLGDVDSADAANNPSDPCYGYVVGLGPTTVLTNGQHYIDWPSMPLIPAYVSDGAGNLSGSAEVCGVDYALAEVGLDFSVMAPLPHSLQRPGAQGSGFTDLLGIAPGASYRLVVPNTNTISYIDEAFLGAAQQTPRPNVITSSIGFGYDEYGFPSRYLEDDPLTEAIVASVVQQYGIVFCLAAGDGLRTLTSAAVSPSGGAVATNVVRNGGTPTNLNDVGLSTMPSFDYDSGAVDVGGTTLNDIFAAQPQNPQNAALVSQFAYPETRYTGFTLFASAFGTRVDVSAPSDNVLSFAHQLPGTAQQVTVGLEGGTSASAPEVAAAAAVALQVARLTGHPLKNPAAVRKLLETTGTPVPRVPQSEIDNAVGPQIDVTHMVESLLANAGKRAAPRAARVAVELRQKAGYLDGAFYSYVDPSAIDLSAGADQWVTVAPDWEGMPAGVRYDLTVQGRAAKPLATTPWARLLPAAILTAAGKSVSASSSQTVKLLYRARLGNKVLASAPVSLTFGPAPATSYSIFAPIVPPVVTGKTIPVKYDLRGAEGVSNPTLYVSEPGRVNPDTGQIYRPAYSVALTSPNGTVRVPVSALQGGGIYGIGIQFADVSGAPVYTDFAYTRVQPTASDARPAAPLLSANGSVPTYLLEIPYNGSFQLTYDVSSVPGATGAQLEVSAPGPTAWSIWNPFNNPNGTQRDDNGVDTGSIYYGSLSGTKGTVTLKASLLGLVPTLNETVRVIPTRFGAPAGEASEVSTIEMDGVFASDGGYANNGYGINANGYDGYLTSSQTLASGSILSSVETFSQPTNSIVATVESSTGSTAYATAGWGVWGNDVGIAAVANAATGNDLSFNVLSPVAAGALGPAWTPASTLSIFGAAANTSTSNGAFLAQDTTAPSSDNWRVFTSNIVANAFGTPIDVTPALSGFGYPYFTSITQNTQANQAIAVGGDVDAFFTGVPRLAVVNLASGTVASVTDSASGAPAGYPQGLTLNATTNTASIAGIQAVLDSVNLTNLSVQRTFLPGYNASFQVQENPGIYPAADATNGALLVAQPSPADEYTNNNALGDVLVYDGSGNLQKTLERFYLDGVYLPFEAQYLQLNPNARKGYMIGAFEQEIEPFSY